MPARVSDVDMWRGGILRSFVYCLAVSCVVLLWRVLTALPVDDEEYEDGQAIIERHLVCGSQ